MPRSRDWWTLEPQQQKRELEEAIGWYLTELGEDLSNRQKLLLRDAIAHAFRGLFGLARQDIYDLQFDEGAWAAVSDDMVAGVNHSTLTRGLEVLKVTVTQTPPIFR